jgi:hypothetical protein
LHQKALRIVSGDIYAVASREVVERSLCKVGFPITGVSGDDDSLSTAKRSGHDSCQFIRNVERVPDIWREAIGVYGPALKQGAKFGSTGFRA